PYSLPICFLLDSLPIWQQLLTGDVVEAARRRGGAGAALGQVGPLGPQLPALGPHGQRGLGGDLVGRQRRLGGGDRGAGLGAGQGDRKSTRLNSSHVSIL